MRHIVVVIGWITTWIGRVFAACTILLIGTIAYALVAQRLLGRPAPWAHDARTMLFGALFMMTGAYLLARNGHLRGDFLYRAWPPRLQAAVDLALHMALLLPGAIAIVLIGYDAAWESWAVHEVSSAGADGLPLYPFKAVVPLAGCLLLLQAAAEAMRCIVCLRTGAWLPRPRDLDDPPGSRPQARPRPTEAIE